MTPRDLARNKRVIFYISGFCLLGILLTFTLRDMYVTFRTRFTREVAQQQILAVRSISHALEDDLDSIIEDLRESSKYLTGSHSHVGVLETAVKSFFSKKRRPRTKRKAPSTAASYRSDGWTNRGTRGRG